MFGERIKYFLVDHFNFTHTAASIICPVWSGIPISKGDTIGAVSKRFSIIVFKLSCNIKAYNCFLTIDAELNAVLHNDLISSVDFQYCLASS